MIQKMKFEFFDELHFIYNSKYLCIILLISECNLK